MITVAAGNISSLGCMRAGTSAKLSNLDDGRKVLLTTRQGGWNRLRERNKVKTKNHSGGEETRNMSEAHVEMEGHKDRFKGVANEGIIVRGSTLVCLINI